MCCDYPQSHWTRTRSSSRPLPGGTILKRAKRRLSVPLDMLVDTGATVSLVDKKVYDLVKTGCPLRKVKSRLIADNGESLQVYGETCLELMLQGHLVKHNVIVCDLPGAKAIMGVDLIEDLGGMLDVANGALHART